MCMLLSCLGIILPKHFDKRDETRFDLPLVKSNRKFSLIHTSVNISYRLDKFLLDVGVVDHLWGTLGRGMD